MEWISVKDKLPEPYVDVLIFYQYFDGDEHGIKNFVNTSKIINPHLRQKIYENCKCGARLHCERERDDKNHYRWENYSPEYWMPLPRIPKDLE